MFTCLYYGVFNRESRCYMLYVVCLEQRCWLEHENDQVGSWVIPGTQGLVPHERGHPVWCLVGSIHILVVSNQARRNTYKIQYIVGPRTVRRAIRYVMQFMCVCLLYTSPSPRDQRGSRMPSSA